MLRGYCYSLFVLLRVRLSSFSVCILLVSSGCACARLVSCQSSISYLLGIPREPVSRCSKALTPFCILCSLRCFCCILNLLTVVSSPDDLSDAALRFRTVDCRHGVTWLSVFFTHCESFRLPSAKVSVTLFSRFPDFFYIFFFSSLWYSLGLLDCSLLCLVSRYFVVRISRVSLNFSPWPFGVSGGAVSSDSFLICS